MTETFDYVIVGAGSAGCAVAARLSEDPAVTVCLIEAGPADKHPFLKMPLAFIEACKLDRYVQRYESEPEPALGGRKIPIPRGRTLGGSSSINGMVYARGHRRDYDDWRALGFEGWGYDDLLPLFRRMESSWRGADQWHGDCGPVGVSRATTPSMSLAALRKAASSAGHTLNPDPAGGALEGFSEMELTVKQGVRSSASAAYLATARSRQNLVVRTEGHVAGLVLEEGRTTAVRVMRGGEEFLIKARREIVLSAGAYGSPQLMMLSGIGPGQELQAHGIRTHVDLPGVGRSLMEHPLTHLGYLANHDRTFLRELRADRLAMSLAQWALFRNGPLTCNGVGANIYLRTDDTLDRPDIKLVCGSVGLDAAVWFPGLTRPPVHRLTCGVSLLASHSRGCVRLRSADPLDAPRILFNLLSDERDVRALVAGIRAARKIYAQRPMAAQIASEAAPGEHRESDEDLAAYVREFAAIGHHPAGTCAMGEVVDQNLRVIGVGGLRVADASILPIEITGNLNVPVMLIGERAADLVRGR